MGTATGTSWGTMAILYPLMLVPTYEASDGNPEIFYATVSAVLGGAVAGDHVSPISDTTVLSSLACDVTLMGHVTTQAPYVFWVVVFSVLFGYLPIGYGAYPNIVGLLLGWIFCGAFVMLVCAPVIDKDGSWDRITELLCRRSDELKELANDCSKKYRGESLENEVEVELEISLNLEHDDDTNNAATDDASNEDIDNESGDKDTCSKTSQEEDTGKDTDKDTDKDTGKPIEKETEETSQEEDTGKHSEIETEETKPLVDVETAPPKTQADGEKGLSSDKSEEESA